MENASTQPKSQATVAVWAIDPLEAEAMPSPALVQEVLNRLRVAGAEIQPVHVLSTPKDNEGRPLAGVGLSRYIETVEKMAERYVEHLGMTGARPVKVLVAGASRHDEVKTLVDYIEAQRAPWVIVTSQGRSGVQRLVMGSFAENLLLRCGCPVLFLTHARFEQNKIKRVLFATDFSDYSKHAFRLFLADAKRFGLEVSLFHSVSLPASVCSSGDGAPVVVPENYFQEQVEWAKVEATGWIKLAESYGVPAKFLVKDEGFAPHTADTIIKFAKQESVGAIVMTSMSGALSSFVMGSVAREVFRANQYPVWIYGPKALEGKDRAQESAGKSATA